VPTVRPKPMHTSLAAVPCRWLHDSCPPLPVTFRIGRLILQKSYGWTLPLLFLFLRLRHRPGHRSLVGVCLCSSSSACVECQAWDRSRDYEDATKKVVRQGRAPRDRSKVGSIVGMVRYNLQGLALSIYIFQRPPDMYRHGEGVISCNAVCNSPLCVRRCELSDRRFRTLFTGDSKHAPVFACMKSTSSSLEHTQRSKIGGTHWWYTGLRCCLFMRPLHRNSSTSSVLAPRRQPQSCQQARSRCTVISS